MSESFAERGRKLLDRAWTIALETSGEFAADKSLAAACDVVFANSEVGYKKALIIQAAGKAADVTLDAQAMQKGAGQAGSWDAREFAKSVFVPWNSEAGEPFSHASDPYVSHPYRVAKFDETGRSKRRKPTEFDAALEVIKYLETAKTSKEAFNNLTEVVYALRRFIADRSVDYPIPSRASLTDTLRAIDDFVSKRSGGARLQAVVFALFKSLFSQGMNYSNLRSRHVNASDTSVRVAGDVLLELTERQCAIEVKDKALSRAELEATIDKCRKSAVTEVILVIRAENLLDFGFDEDSFKHLCEKQFSSGLNVYVERFDYLCSVVLTLVGEEGRRTFLEAVGTALQEQSADITHKWDWAAIVKAT